MRTIWNQLWNQRRSNAWILVELTVVNVLLWYAITKVQLGNRKVTTPIVCSTFR